MNYVLFIFFYYHIIEQNSLFKGFLEWMILIES